MSSIRATLIEYVERDKTLGWDLRITRDFPKEEDGTKRTDHVYIPITSNQARMLQSVEVPFDRIITVQEALEDRFNETAK